jgi:hypothetical protein
MANTETYENSTGQGRGPATLGPTELDGRPAGREDPSGQEDRRRLRERVPAQLLEGPLPKIYLGLIAAITLVGFLFRLRSFGNSLQGDEISTFYIVHGHSLARVLSLLHSRQETTPPLYFVLAWITKGWLGNEAESIRLVSLLAGTVAIPLTFLLGLRTVGRRAALVGATIFACDPFMIYFSTEARTYMLVVFLCLLSTVCLLRAVDVNRPIWWVGYAASTCAAAYSHYSVVFYLVAQLVWVLWAVPRVRKYVLIANVAAVIGFLPWISVLRADLDAPNFIGRLLPVNVHNLVDLGEHFWIGHPIILVRNMPGDIALWLVLIGLVVGAVGIAQAALRQRQHLRWTISAPQVLIVVLAVAPAVLMVLYSWLRVDVLGGGNIIATWPALALAMGALVTAPPRPFRIAAVTLTIAAYAIGGVRMLSPESQRGNVAAAVTFIERTGRSGDPIVSEPFFSNPLSEVDAALADTPSWTYTPGNTLDRARPRTPSDPHPVVRFGIPPYESPPLDEQFHFLAEPDPNPVFFGLPQPTPPQVAQKAMSIARNGTVFLVTPYPIMPHVLLKYFPHNAMTQFIRAMEPRYHIVQSVTYPGDISMESVYVFRDSQSSSGKHG